VLPRTGRTLGDEGELGVQAARALTVSDPLPEKLYRESLFNHFDTTALRIIRSLRDLIFYRCGARLSASATQQGLRGALSASKRQSPGEFRQGPEQLPAGRLPRNLSDPVVYNTEIRTIRLKDRHFMTSDTAGD